MVYDYIDVTLPATTVTIPTEPNTAYATTVRQTNTIETKTNVAYDVITSSTTTHSAQ